MGGGPLPDRDPPPDGRWQRGDVVDAVYLADSQETAWAEWYRHLAELGLPPDRQLPRNLWTWEVSDVLVADLSDDRELRRAGLPLPRPGRRGWPRFQDVGEALWRTGHAGLLAPSAARLDGLVLCLFKTPGSELPARPRGRPRTIRRPPVPPTGMRT